MTWITDHCPPGYRFLVQLAEGDLNNELEARLRLASIFGPRKAKCAVFRKGCYVQDRPYDDKGCHWHYDAEAGFMAFIPKGR